MWLNTYLAAQKLPLGHIGRKKADFQLSFEYFECKKIEEKYRGVILDIRQAQFWADKICDKLGVHKKVKICVNCNLPFVVYGQSSYPNKIEFCTRRIKSIALCHEIAHHICRVERLNGANHRGDFLWVLKFCLDCGA